MPTNGMFFFKFYNNCFFYQYEAGLHPLVCRCSDSENYEPPFVFRYHAFDGSHDNIFKTRNISEYNEKPSAKIGITTNVQNTNYIKNTSDIGKFPNIL